MYTIFGNTSKANPNILSEIMYREQFRFNAFGKWVGGQFVKAMGLPEEVGSLGSETGPKFTGAPIEVFERFIKEGHNTMDIPVRNRLVEMPVHGDSPATGTGEGARVTYRTIRINRTRKIYNPPTGMNYQKVKQFADNLVFKAKDYMQLYLNDYHPGNFILTLLAGQSRDLVASVAQDGLGLPYVSHPNLVVAGSGLVSYSGGRPGSAGYEAAVAAAINTLGNSPEDYFSVRLVETVVLEAIRKKIAPIVMQDGFRFYPIWVNDSQWAQLQQDPQFRQWMYQIPVELTKNPIGNGAKAVIGGAVIYTDLNLWGVRTTQDDANVAADTVEYGPAPTAAERGKGYKVGNWIKNLDQSDRRMGFLIGAGAISVGVGERMTFTEQLYDHGNVQEIGLDMIQSNVRTDIYDSDGKIEGLAAGDFHENTSSLAFATYSPWGLVYS